MSTLIGVLLDVSDSMKNSVGDRPDVGEGSWARSVFRVIDDIVKNDVSSDNKVFGIGFGARYGSGIFDIISTVKQFQNERNERMKDSVASVGIISTVKQFQNKRISDSAATMRISSTMKQIMNAVRSVENPVTDGTIEEILGILERSGAYNVRKWAEKRIIQQSVTEYLATLILSKLKSDRDFKKTFVYECLPKICRDWDPPKVPKVAAWAAQWLVSTTVTKVKRATKEDIDEVVTKSMRHLLKAVCKESVFSAHDAYNVLHGCVDEHDLSAERSQELLKIIEPFIYGRTPLYESIETAFDVFLDSKNPKQQKLLFLLSDGMPTDINKRERALAKLKIVDVTVVSCLISRASDVEPKRLYSCEHDIWDDAAKCLYRLSSKVPTQLLPRAIFLKRGWHIEVTNNETRLFMHVNHPDNVRDACDLARNVICCQDALSDLLVSVSLDIYINQTTEGEQAHKQVGGTCYANASAVVLHLAMKRILGRDGGYPDFADLREELISNFGDSGANTLKVLQKICPKYRLQCLEVQTRGAMEAVADKRPVVAIFCLTDVEWKTFSDFFDKNPKGVLTKTVLDISRRNQHAKTDGHAVVLVSYNSESLRLMNSWGEQWADMGFFRVENADVLGLEFFDVYWTLNDLSDKEKRFYETHGPEVANKLVQNLRSLQVASYTCPVCKQSSLVTEFTGTMSRPKCPICGQKFSTSDGEGNILALNLYLTSLSR